MKAFFKRGLHTKSPGYVKYKKRFHPSTSKSSIRLRREENVAHLKKLGFKSSKKAFPVFFQLLLWAYMSHIFHFNRAFLALT